MNDQKKLQIQHYRSLAPNFDISQRRDNRNHRKKIAAINKHLDLTPFSQVLEVGVGTGIHAKYLLDWNKSKYINFTGIDLSEDMLRVCADRLSGHSNVKLAVMDAENLTFSDNTFDAAFISGSLHHFSNCFKALQEMVRVIKPRSKFCVMEPNWIFPFNLYASKVAPSEKICAL